MIGVGSEGGENGLKDGVGSVSFSPIGVDGVLGLNEAREYVFRWVGDVGRVGGEENGGEAGGESGGGGAGNSGEEEGGGGGQG